MPRRAGRAPAGPPCLRAGQQSAEHCYGAPLGVRAIHVPWPQPIPTLAAVLRMTDCAVPLGVSMSRCWQQLSSTRRRLGRAEPRRGCYRADVRRSLVSVIRPPASLTAVTASPSGVSAPGWDRRLLPERVHRTCCASASRSPWAAAWLLTCYSGRLAGWRGRARNRRPVMEGRRAWRAQCCACARPQTNAESASHSAQPSDCGGSQIDAWGERGHWASEGCLPRNNERPLVHYAAVHRNHDEATCV